MHKIRVRSVKPKVKAVIVNSDNFITHLPRIPVMDNSRKIHPIKRIIHEEILQKKNIFPIERKGNVQETESKKPTASQKEIDAMPIIEATPTTKAAEITALIVPAPEQAKEQRNPALALEPRIRELASSTSQTSEPTRPYKSPRDPEYSPAPAGTYTPAQKNAEQIKEYQIEINEPLRFQRTRDLQPPWRKEQEREQQNFPHDPRIPDVREQYEIREYEQPSESGRRERRKKQPWE